MTENNPPEKMLIDDWTFRIKQPLNPTDESKALLLLHGYLGNENVMWVLTNPIPESYFILSPRAPIKNGPDQFSWHEIVPQWPDINTYEKLTTSLLDGICNGPITPRKDKPNCCYSWICALLLEKILHKHISCQ